MTRLIDADALISECDSLIQVNATPNRYIDLIKNAPAVEYTFEEAFQKTVCDNKLYCPNKRPEGEWITIHDEKYGDNVKCPFCGKEIAGTDLNFCVKCGAEMVKGAKNDR